MDCNVVRIWKFQCLLAYTQENIPIIIVLKITCYIYIYIYIYMCVCVRKTIELNMFDLIGMDCQCKQQQQKPKQVVWPLMNLDSLDFLKYSIK